MIVLYKLYLKMLASSVLLLGCLICISPARAEFGFSGLEFSPVRTFISAGAESFNTYSGTINFKLSDPTTELSIPILWSKDKSDEFYDGYETWVVDIQLRKFDKPSRDGGYVGLIARSVSAKNYSRDSGSTNDTRQTDFGVGLVAGFRQKISSGFYWGANASLVAFSDEPTSLDIGEAELYRQKVSFTFDFLKIGYEF